jgi:hypothetical protein
LSFPLVVQCRYRVARHERFDARSHARILHRGIHPQIVDIELMSCVGVDLKEISTDNLLFKNNGI